LAINPKGQIPALAINADTLLTEGVAIMQYVADSAPKSDLLPPVGFLSRYKTLEWLNFVATELHKGFTPCFVRIRRKRSNRPLALCWKRNWSMLTRRWQINSGLMARTSPLPMHTCSRYCAGR
jgi:glutathione S-transferase